MSLLFARCVATAALCVSGVAADVAAEPVLAHDATSDEVGARFVRMLRGGGAVGLKAFAIKPRSVVARMGLVPGDLVTHVRGVAVTDAQPIVDAIRAHAGGTAFDLTVVRAGKAMVLRSP